MHKWLVGYSQNSELPKNIFPRSIVLRGGNLAEKLTEHFMT